MTSFHNAPPAPGPQPRAYSGDPAPTLMYSVTAPPQFVPRHTAAVPPPGSPIRPGPQPLPPRGAAARVRLDPQVGRVLLAGLGLVGVALGVSLPSPVGIGWSAYTAWSIFATVCALAGLAAAALSNSPIGAFVQAGVAGALVLYWLIAVRPIAISDIGFLGTLGVMGAIVAALVHPRRPRLRPAMVTLNRRPT